MIRRSGVFTIMVRDDDRPSRHFLSNGGDRGLCHGSYAFGVDIDDIHVGSNVLDALKISEHRCIVPVGEHGGAGGGSLKDALSVLSRGVVSAERSKAGIVGCQVHCS